MDDVEFYKKAKKEWLREDDINQHGTMYLKKFAEHVKLYDKEILCDGKGGIASHNIPGSVYIKMINPTTGKELWGNVKWIEPTIMMGCGCWDGIKIVAEVDE